MSKKGKKMGLREFLGEGFVPEGQLPRAPREQSEEERQRYNARRQSPFGADNTPPRGIETEEGAGDSVDNWRRGPSDGMSNERGGRREERRFAAGDDDDNWRRGGARQGEESEPIVSRGDQDSDWRRGGARPTGDEQGVVRGGEQDSDWRRTAGENSALAGPPQPPKSDQDSDWRKSTVKPAGPPPPRAEDDDDWRRTKAVEDKEVRGPSAADKSSSWRSASSKPKPTGDNRPRLNLKPRSKDGEGAEKTETATTSDDREGEQEKTGKDKWDTIFRKQGGRSGRRFGDNTRDQERENAFKAFGGAKREPRNFEQERENRERAFGAFSGSRRNDNRGGRSDAFNSFNGGGRRGDDRETRQAERERAFAAFGGGRRDDRRDDRRGDDRHDERRREDKGGYQGGMERLRKNRPVEVEEEVQVQSEPGKLPTMSKTTSWGAEEEVVAPAKKQLSEGELQVKTESFLKEYLVMEDKREALSAVRALNTKSYMPNVVKRALEKTVDSGNKEVKLVAQLILSFVKEKELTKEQIKEGVEQFCASVESDAKKVHAERVGTVFEEKSIFEGLTLSTEAKKVLFPNAAAAESESENSGNVVQELISSGKKGAELVEAAGDTLKGQGAKVLGEILSNKDLLMDAKSKWADKTEFGALLSGLLYVESPSSSEVKPMVEALYVLQSKLHELSFPKVDIQGKKVGLIEQIFTKLYAEDILPEEAFLEWKDDVSDSPGKIDAIVQSTAFCTWLEQEDESSEEEED